MYYSFMLLKTTINHKIMENNQIDVKLEKKLEVDEEPLSKEAIKNIEKALEDVKKEGVYSTEEVRRILGTK